LLALVSGSAMLLTSTGGDAIKGPMRLLIPPGMACNVESPSRNLRGWQLGFSVLPAPAVADPMLSLQMPAVIPGPFPRERWLDLCACFDAFTAKPGTPTLRARLLMDALIADILIEGFASGTLNVRADAGAAPGWLSNLATWIYRHATDRTIDLTRLATEAGVSIPTLTAGFRRAYRESPMSFLRRQRIHLGARLLRERRDESIAQIAYRCCFGSSSLFTRHFRHYMGVSPRVWRQTGVQQMELALLRERAVPSRLA
jgi:AraC-like DNA-binding protein